MRLWALVGLVFGGLAVAAGAATAGLAVTTSGPFAGSASEAATATPVPTQVATASPTAATTTEASASPTASMPTRTVPVDAQGWPIVSCPAGLVVQRSATRKVTGCGPGDFRFTNDEQEPSDGSTQDELAIEWLNRSLPWEYMSLQIVDRANSRFTRVNWQDPCRQKTPTTLLGFPAEQCLITRDDLNGTALYPFDDWGVEVFVETPDYWIIADAVGPQTGSARQPAIDRALSVFASIHANGLERVK